MDWLEAEVAATPSDDDQVLLLDEALVRLAAVRPQAAKLVQLRFFSGLTLEEAAPVVGLSSRSARRLWAFARAWLHVGTVRVGGAKMAKSTGNLVLVRDVLATARPAALRLALLDRPNTIVTSVPFHVGTPIAED